MGEIGVTAELFCSGLSDAHRIVDQRPEIAERWAIWRREKASRAADDHGRGVNSASIFEALSKLVPEDAVISVDVGNNTYSFGRCAWIGPGKYPYIIWNDRQQKTGRDPGFG